MEASQGIVIVLGGMIFAGMLGFSVIMMFVFFRKKATFLQSQFELELKNRELEQMNAVVVAQEQERAKIARNLHDELGAILSMAQRNLNTTLTQMPHEIEWRDDLRFILDVLDESVVKIRLISHDMMPHFLVKFGLLKTLQRLMIQTEKSLGHTCTFSTNITEDLELEEQQEIHFYCVVLELLNNLLKHGHPKCVDMSLMLNSTHLSVEMRHDGVAISQADYEHLLHYGDGVGLVSVAHRLNLISGEVLYRRHQKGGAIELAMPFKNRFQVQSDEKI
jgi:signal transduction histidine kinase